MTFQTTQQGQECHTRSQKVNIWLVFSRLCEYEFPAKSLLKILANKLPSDQSDLESVVDVYEAEHGLDHCVVLVEEEEDDGVGEGRLLGHLTSLQDPLVQQGQHPRLWD